MDLHSFFQVMLYILGCVLIVSLTFLTIRLIFTFQAISYAWYINMFIGLYILIPFLNKIVKSSSKKELQLFILVLLIISILPATWNNFSEILGYSNIFPLPNFWISIYPISYYIVGCYLKVHPVKLKTNVRINKTAKIFFISFTYCFVILESFI